MTRWLRDNVQPRTASGPARAVVERIESPESVGDRRFAAAPGRQG